MPVDGLIKERVRLACHMLPDQPSWLEEALRYGPTNALCLARLAQVQARWNSTIGVPILAQLDWLTRRAMDLAPDEPVVQRAGALAPARHSDSAGALQLMERVRQAGFEETCFLVDFTDLLVKARRLPEAYAVFEAALKWEPESESPLRGSHAEILIATIGPKSSPAPSRTRTCECLTLQSRIRLRGRRTYRHRCWT